MYNNTLVFFLSYVILGGKEIKCLILSCVFLLLKFQYLYINIYKLFSSSCHDRSLFLFFLILFFALRQGGPEKCWISVNPPALPLLTCSRCQSFNPYQFGLYILSHILRVWLAHCVVSLSLCKRLLMLYISLFFVINEFQKLHGLHFSLLNKYFIVQLQLCQFPGSICYKLSQK